MQSKILDVDLLERSLVVQNSWQPRRSTPDISDEISILRDLAPADEARRAVSGARIVRGDGSQANKTISPGTLGNLQPKHIAQIEYAFKDPWGMAIRCQLQILGWRLYAKGGTITMSAALNSMDTSHDGGRFAAMVDKVWNGIGFVDDPRLFWRA